MFKNNAVEHVCHILPFQNDEHAFCISTQSRTMNYFFTLLSAEICCETVAVIKNNIHISFFMLRMWPRSFN